MSQRRQFTPTNSALADNTKIPFSDHAFQATPSLVSTDNDIGNLSRLHLSGIKKNSRISGGRDHAGKKLLSRSEPQGTSMNSHVTRDLLPPTRASDVFPSRPISSAASDPFPMSLQCALPPTLHFRSQLSPVTPERGLGVNFPDFPYSQIHFRAEDLHPSLSDAANDSSSPVGSSIQQMSQDQKSTIIPMASAMSPGISARSPATHSMSHEHEEDKYNQALGDKPHSSTEGPGSELYERSGGKRCRTTRDMNQCSDDDSLITPENFKRQKPDNLYNMSAGNFDPRIHGAHRLIRHDDPIQRTALDISHGEPSTVFSSQNDRVTVLRQKWNACTLEEWHQGGNDITKKFSELVEFAQEYMCTKVKIYSLLHARTEDRNKKLLDLRDERLKQAREMLVNQTDALVGHSK
ncbi:hypothetical protein BS47DRAFT_1489277 [Hydnum rufescens UP504]|uniref:Extracellular mutant protein 11 C-terminal domain-containing protein n=1 Tax=Hydnum rufescens UP504 TaxID=1448309 RepID=A0A9P6AIN8_9AGAM|nr:hypothetical protein BS47DRAFT_1489277 [Hydnum rufescens UP504]